MSRLIYIFFMIVILMVALGSNLQVIKHIQSLKEMKVILELEDLDAVEQYIMNKRIGVL